MAHFNKFEASKSSSSAPTRRISQDNTYERPEQTITDMLQSSDEIRRKLNGYARVTNIDSIPLNTHVRYITWKNGKERFTLGGKIRKIDPRYVVLYNQNFSWTVQRKHYSSSGKEVVFETVFFNKLSEVDRCKIALVKQQEELESVKKENEKLRRSLMSRNRFVS